MRTQPQVLGLVTARPLLTLSQGQDAESLKDFSDRLFVTRIHHCLADSPPFDKLRVAKFLEVLRQ
jgi:hypothetical protein